MIPVDLGDSLYKINCSVFINVISKRVRSVKNRIWRVFMQLMHKKCKVNPKH